MSFIVSKQNGKLLFIDNGSYQTRNKSTIWCIEKADKIYKWNDFKNLTINTNDYEIDNLEYTYSKMNSYNNLIPDFNFHAWPEVGINDYDEMINKIDKAGKNEPKINKVGWIGNLNTHSNRHLMFKIGEANKNLFDFTGMNWIKDRNKDKNNDKKLDTTAYMSLDELVKTYSILIDIEGNGYSGRLKYLLWSRRPVLLVDRPHKEYFFEYLKEWKHYIPVKRNLSDLVEKTMWCINNYDKALKIAKNAYIFSETHLTRNAAFAQWNRIITQHINSSIIIQNTTYKIIVARYNENIDWLKTEIDNCVIYNKGEQLNIKNEIPLKNLGREAETYLHYVITNYYDLPDIVVFTQGKISDHVGSDDINYLIKLKNEAIQYSKSQNFITHFDIGKSPYWDKEWNLQNGKYYLESNYKNNKPITFYKWFTHNVIQDYPSPINIYRYAIFAVKKEKILANPIEYYETLILEINHHINSTEGHFFERSWYYIFE